MATNMEISKTKAKTMNGMPQQLKSHPGGGGSFSTTTLESEESEDSEDSDENSAEEEIITEGARAQLSSSKLDHPSINHVIKAPREHEDPPPDEDDSTTDDEGEDSDVETESEPELEPEANKPVRQASFSPPEELPSWFPENIKKIYRTDHHGGALKYSVPYPRLCLDKNLTSSRNSTKSPGTEPYSKTFVGANGGNTLKQAQQDGSSTYCSTACASGLGLCRRSTTSTERDSLRSGRRRR
jgi:hypothetical protein